MLSKQRFRSFLPFRGERSEQPPARTSATPPPFVYDGSYLNYHDDCITSGLFAGSVAKIVCAMKGKDRLRLAFAGMDYLLPIAYTFAEYGYEIVGFFGGENRTGLHPQQPLDCLTPDVADVVFVSAEREIQRELERRFTGSPVQVMALAQVVDAHRRTLQSLNRSYFNTCLDARKLSILAIVNSLTPNGCFVECGVYLGGGTVYVAKLDAWLGKRRRILALDTFEGMPSPVEKDGDTPFQAGLFSDNQLDRVKHNYAVHDVLDRIETHKGLVQDTLPQLKFDHNIALALLDTDQYSGTIAGLHAVLPHLMEGGVVVVDDADGAGVSAAIDEALGEYAGFRRLAVIRGFHLVVRANSAPLRRAA
jgi:hypothetical protein